MTDRIKGLAVLLERNFREDDAQHIINAIKQLRGVRRVERYIERPTDDWFAEQRVRDDLVEKLWEVLR